MSYTKRQFVEAAFEEIGLAAYVYDLTPQQMESALRRLDAMMATWNAQGLRLAYPLPSSPELSALAQETDVPDRANEAIILNLALRLAPSYGKVVMPETKAVARKAFDVLLARATHPLEKQLPETMPVGAGQKPWNIDQPFFDTPVDPVLTGPEGPLELN